MRLSITLLSRLRTPAAVASAASVSYLCHRVAAAEAAQEPRPCVQASNHHVAKLQATTMMSAAEEKLAVWKQAINAMYTNPFKSIFGIAAPLYALIFYQESTSPATAHFPLSQRIIHTRVFGQAIAITTTIGIMTLVTLMDRRGGAFEAPGSEKHSGELLKQYSVSAENYGRPKRSDAEKAGLVPREEHGISYDVLVPLFIVPAIPFVTIVLRNRVSKETMQRIVMGLIGLGLAHAAFVQFGDSTMTNG